ncbi:MAG TPA: DegT/DnrJ/EryC1/StrS family aminotransferase [Candidatus Sulfotelmatobacter sp.]|nr:DegT/DnrJ/EryC1/StrS family aminotransferase [Candidatus Sulfotelmatobacter sp.]
MTSVLDESIQVTRIPFARTEISAEAQASAARVLASGWVTTGPEVVEFEREFAKLVDAEHAIAVASCTAGIEIALRALRLPRGARVLSSTMTFCGAVNAIVHSGYEPVLVDVNARTLMPDAETVAAAVRKSGPADAMVVIHFAGHPAPVEEMAAAAGLPLTRVIEDAAHAVGTKVGERWVGAISAATCFSFYATKNLPIGEGGMITTNDPELADFSRQVRLHGMSRDAWKRYLPGSGWRYQVDEAGIKANMTDVQAAIGRGQLLHFAEWQDRRRELAAAYERRLSRIGGVHTPDAPDAGEHAWHLYVIQLDPSFGVDRDTFIKVMSERGVDCSVHFIPLHHQPYYQRLIAGQANQSFPVADSVFPNIVSLPFHPGLTDDMVDRICEEIDGIRQSVWDERRQWPVAEAAV